MIFFVSGCFCVPGSRIGSKSICDLNFKCIENQRKSDLLSMKSSFSISDLYDFIIRPPEINNSIPRPKIDMKFAVLLMRTSYQITDQLDFIPMNQFQKDFFLLRSKYYESYIKSAPTHRQGELSDPNYFDFISFAQFATISQAMESPQKVFRELYNADGDTQIVRNSLNSEDFNAVGLKTEFYELVGDALLDELLDKDDLNTIQNVSGNKGLISSIQYVLELLLKCGYALQMEFQIEETNSNENHIKFTLEWTAPLNLWSEQYLRRLHKNVFNEYDVMILFSLLKRFSYQNNQITYTTLYTSTSTKRVFTVRNSAKKE